MAPGGTLVVVGYASLPPWSWKELDEPAVDEGQQHGHGHGHGHGDLPSPGAVLAGLALDDTWEAVRVDVAPRAVIGPDGEAGSMDDSVVVVRRAGTRPGTSPQTSPQTSSASPSSSRSTSSLSV